MAKDNTLGTVLTIAIAGGLLYYLDTKGYLNLGLASLLGKPGENIPPVVTNPNAPLPTPSPTTPTPLTPGIGGMDGTLDKFGVKKIYKSIDGGKRDWFEDWNNWDGPKPVAKDGGWSIGPRSRAGPAPLGGSRQGDADPGCDHGVLAKRGYYISQNDWKNVEMTGFYKYGGKGGGACHGGQCVHIYARSYDHNTRCNGCYGSSYNNEYCLDNGMVRMSKETQHGNVEGGAQQDKQGAMPPATGKFIGFKSIIYNTRNNTAVMQECWGDKAGLDAAGKPSNNWVKVASREDTGQVSKQKCGSGATGLPITWGGIDATFRWDCMNTIFKYISVREIIPPVP